MSKKFDQGKPRVDLINPRFIEELGQGLGFGATKYSDYNYKEGEGLDRSRLYASAMRHLLKYAQGEKIDIESSVSHLTAVAINCMMLYTLEEESKGREYAAWKKDNDESKKVTKKRGKRRISSKIKKPN